MDRGEGISGEISPGLLTVSSIKLNSGPLHPMHSFIRQYSEGLQWSHCYHIALEKQLTATATLMLPAFILSTRLNPLSGAKQSACCDLTDWDAQLKGSGAGIPSVIVHPANCRHLNQQRQMQDPIPFLLTPLICYSTNFGSPSGCHL